MKFNLTQLITKNGSVIDDSRLRQVGLVLIVVIFGGFGGWAALAALSSSAMAPGFVTVENYRKTIQHLEGGIVDQILVKDGDWVEKDQVLVILNDTQFRAQLEVLWGQVVIDLAREARLVALRDNQTQIVFPSELLERQSEARVAEAVRIQNQTFMARRSAHENEIRLYEEQIAQLRAKLVGLSAQKKSADQMQTSYQGELHDFEELLKEGYTERQTVRDLERKYADSMGKSGELQSAIAAVNLQINEIQLKILQLKQELQREVIKELTDVQAELFELREKLRAVRSTVERCVVKAPESGKVMGLAVHTIGGVIAPGHPILEIVPQNEKLLIEARLSPLDIDRVNIGQSAEIRFDVFKAKKLPRIQGNVVALSADIIADPNVPEQKYYLARIEVSPEGLNTLASLSLELLPGMPAQALIHTGERTFFEYLSDPISESFSKAFIED